MSPLVSSANREVRNARIRLAHRCLLQALEADHCLLYDPEFQEASRAICELKRSTEREEVGSIKP